MTSPAESPVAQNAPAPLPALRAEMVFQALYRRWMWLLITTVTTPLLAWIGWSFMPERFEARARVTVQDPQTVNPFLGDLAVEWDAEDRATLITSILRSPSTMETVLRELGTVTDRSTLEEIERETRSLAERMMIVEVGGGVVLIKLISARPEESFHGVQALVNAFVHEMLRPQRDNVTASSNFLESELATIEGELSELEHRITTFRQEHADQVPEMRSATLAEHHALRQALVEAELHMQSTTRQVQATEERLRALSPDERALEALVTEARSNLARARAELGDEHPRIAAARARVRELETQLRTARGERHEVDLDRLEAQTAGREDGEGSGGPGVLTSELLAYRGMLREREGAAAEASLLRERIGTARSTLIASVTVEEELGMMMREIEARRSGHAELLTRAQQARVMRDLATQGDLQQVWVLEPPVLPTQSLKPARWLVTIGGFLGGLVLGIVLIAVGESMSRLVRTPEEAALAVGARRAFIMPRLGKGP